MPRVGGGQCQWSVASERRLEDNAVKWPRRYKGIAAVVEMQMVGQAQLVLAMSWSGKGSGFGISWLRCWEGSKSRAETIGMKCQAPQDKRGGGKGR
jgi:hypothetical protein